MGEERFERFVSRDFRGVSVIKSETPGMPLLVGRLARRQAGTHVRNETAHRDVGKDDLVQSVAASAGLSRKQAKLAVDGMIEAISGALKNGQDVRLVGFGTFTLARRKGVTGVNPRTGEILEVKEPAVPSFKAAKSLRASVSDAA